MRTRLTDVLEIEHPVMLAGMGGVSYHRLAAAVSEAGGFGCLGASTMGHEMMIDEIAKTRSLTGKPFGVDLLTAVAGQVESQVQSVIDGGARVFVAGLGIPRDVIDLCHQSNVLVASMCGKVRHATAAVEAGCDIVVAQGTEAGGHTGLVATMATASPSSLREACSTAAGSPRRSRSAPTASGSARGSSPLPRRVRFPDTRTCCSGSPRTAP
jgi:enoyl-[acyl-carrier protein] reductase II